MDRSEIKYKDFSNMPPTSCLFWEEDDGEDELGRPIYIPVYQCPTCGAVHWQLFRPDECSRCKRKFNGVEKI